MNIEDLKKAHPEAKRVVFDFTSGECGECDKNELRDALESLLSMVCGVTTTEGKDLVDDPKFCIGQLHAMVHLLETSTIPTIITDEKTLILFSNTVRLTLGLTALQKSKFCGAERVYGDSTATVVMGVNLDKR